MIVGVLAERKRRKRQQRRDDLTRLHGAEGTFDVVIRLDAQSALHAERAAQKVARQIVRDKTITDAVAVSVARVSLIPSPSTRTPAAGSSEARTAG